MAQLFLKSRPPVFFMTRVKDTRETGTTSSLSGLMLYSLWGDADVVAFLFVLHFLFSPPGLTAHTNGKLSIKPGTEKSPGSFGVTINV